MIRHVSIPLFILITPAVSGCPGRLNARGAYDALAEQHCLVNGIAFPCSPSYQWSSEAQMLSCVAPTASTNSVVSCALDEALLVYEVLGYSVYPPGYQVDGVFPLCCPEALLRADGDMVFRVSLPSVFPLGSAALVQNWPGAELSTQVEMGDAPQEGQYRAALCVQGERHDVELANGVVFPIFRAVRRAASDFDDSSGSPNAMTSPPSDVWLGKGFEPDTCR